MRVAYIGPQSGTGLHRAKALCRLGHEVVHIDPWKWLGVSTWTSRWLFHLGGVGVGFRIDRRIEMAVGNMVPDLVFVDQGEFLGRSLISKLRSLDIPIVNYTIDDPFGGRDGLRFQRYIKALPYYDLVAVVREVNVAEARAQGARDVMRVWRSADEVAHAPRAVDRGRRALFSSDVAFVGTWMPERGPFVAELIQRGVPISVWGDRWQKAPEWSVIRPHWRGPGLYNDDDYAAAILSAKVCLGLLSKGNRDLHTQRSLEIPALGGLLCAERTYEHLQLYQDCSEAVFWSDAGECAETCSSLLRDETRRADIARRGRVRALRNNFYNETVLAQMLERAVLIYRGKS